ncbi:MAG: ABC transporter permease subunit [Clostridia bacterium]|jgi:multiple sugar transport system permease protein|nr:ABC transporter permease subunit [Clostridia bacterium]
MVSTQRFKGRVKILAYIILCAGAVIMLLPFVWLVSGAFKTLPETILVPPTWIPRNPTLTNFSKVFTWVPFARYYLNSIVVVLVVLASTLFTCSLAGFAFAKYEFRGRNIIFILILATMMIPFQLIIVPLYIMMFEARLTDTLAALIIPMLTSAYGIFLCRQFMLGIPSSLLDAGRIDGSTEFSLYWKIILPLSKPVLATLAIITFMWNWDSFLWPIIVADSPKSLTLPVGIAQFGQQYSTYYNLQMAASLLMVIPVIALFLALQKYFIEGIVLSGLKM